MNDYRDDLAYIHHHGFREFAESAAPWVVDTLRATQSRTVVEIGCGSGILARELTRAGFEVSGFDASPAMIALARETAPDAQFTVASFDALEIPACDALVAMGEVLNYGDARTFLRRAAVSVRKLLLFDLAERDSYPPYDERRVDGDDWSVIAIQESDGTHLTRRVLTFRADGDTMRRDEETHHLELHDRGEILALLRAGGFRVKTRRSYGPRRLPKGHAVFVATKLLSDTA